MSRPKLTMGKTSKLTTPIGPRESQSREFRLENPRIRKEEGQILYQYLFHKFKIKLRTSNVKPCTCSQEALFIGLQLTATLLYRHPPLPAEYAPYHSTLYPSSKCVVGHLQDACALSKRQGGAWGRTGGPNVPATSLS